MYIHIQPTCELYAYTDCCTTCFCIKYVFHLLFAPVVLRVGTDILFAMACIHDFKQEMLSTAVKDGLLEVNAKITDVCVEVFMLCRE